MKMKLLDYTLIGILASGFAANATAQDAPPASTAQCGESGCESSEGVLFKVRTRGEQRPATNAAQNRGAA